MREIKPLVYLVGRFSRLQKGLCTVQSSVNFMFVITVWSKRPLLYCCCSLEEVLRGHQIELIYIVLIFILGW